MEYLATHDIMPWCRITKGSLSAKDAVFRTRTFFVSFIANNGLVIIAFIHNLQVNLRNKICNLILSPK